MDALYSLKSRGDSFESFVASEQTEEDEYELDFESESEQEDEWEDLGRDDSNSSSCSGGGQNEEDASVTIKPHVQVHQQYFKADATAADRIEERDNSGTGVTADDEPESEPEFERAFEASALIDEPQYLLISAASVATTSGVDRRTQSRLQSALSPSSKSRNAKEVRPTQSKVDTFDTGEPALSNFRFICVGAAIVLPAEGQADRGDAQAHRRASTAADFASPSERHPPTQGARPVPSRSPRRGDSD